MKKFLTPIILFVLAAFLFVYLFVDFSRAKGTFDANAYLSERARIDSLQIALFENGGNPESASFLQESLDSSWENLTSMRSEQALTGSSKASSPASVSSGVMAWIVGGAAAVLLCLILLVVLARRKEALTRKMAAVSHPLEETVAPPSRHSRRSIIEEASEFASRNKADSAGAENVKVAFEDENGVPENKILSMDVDSVKPQLRPTAKERITSAMQSLSDALRSPRGVSRERTMRLRAQSHNVTGDPSLKGSNPLETNRFDREFTMKNKVMQMSRRGFPASAIATSLKIPQEKVEAVIKEFTDMGA